MVLADFIIIPIIVFGGIFGFYKGFTKLVSIEISFYQKIM